MRVLLRWRSWYSKTTAQPRLPPQCRPRRTRLLCRRPLRWKAIWRWVKITPASHNQVLSEHGPPPPRAGCHKGLRLSDSGGVDETSCCHSHPRPCLRAFLTEGDVLPEAKYPRYGDVEIIVFKTCHAERCGLCRILALWTTFSAISSLSQPPRNNAVWFQRVGQNRRDALMPLAPGLALVRC